MMRQLSILFGLLVALSSCDWNSELQHSPEIYTSYFYVNPVFSGDSLVGAKDTLSLFYDAEDESYEMDTLHVGDTVMFASSYYSWNSNLVSVDMDWDSLRMNLWFPLLDVIEKVLTSESKVEEGYMCFDPGYNRVSFPVYFSPIVKGGMTLKLTVKSDSDYPKSSVLFYIPVIEQVVDSVPAN